MNTVGNRRRARTARRLPELISAMCTFVFVTSGGCVAYDLDALSRDWDATQSGGTPAQGGSNESGRMNALGGTTQDSGGHASGGTAAAAGSSEQGGDNDVGGAGGAAGEAGADGEGGTGGASGEGPGGAGGAANSEGGAAGGGEGGAANGEGGAAGSGGEGGEDFMGPCPTSEMTGWATVAGFDFDPAEPRDVAPEVDVSDATALAMYAASPDPYVIRISGTIAIPVLDVTSNKTLIGSDSQATIQGGVRILGTSTDPLDMVSNVVIRNLNIDAATADTSTLPDEDDGVMVAYAHHVWIDHVHVWDAPGDNINVQNGADYVTVSWTKFSSPTALRRTGMRIGHSDTNDAEDSGHLKVSLHHNWWTDSIDQRMPRVRFGQVHVYNNYYSNLDRNWPEDTYAIAAGHEARILIENNYFDDELNPHVFFSFVDGRATFAEPTAQMVATGNTYVGTSEHSEQQSGQGDAFTPAYSVTLEPADEAMKQTIRHCVGPSDPSADPR